MFYGINACIYMAEGKKERKEERRWSILMEL